MADEFKYLENTFTELRGLANQHGRTLHVSFFSELENYSLHRRVRRLSKGDRSLVVAKIGETAVGRAESGWGDDSSEIGAGVVRGVILELCSHPFLACDWVAQQILTEAGKHKEAQLLAEPNEENSANAD